MSSALKVFETEVRAKVKASLEKLGLKISARAIELASPPPGLGDLALACFEYGKKLNLKPELLAEKLAQAMLKTKSELIEKIIPAGAYVNFFISSFQLKQITLSKILELKERYGEGSEKAQKIILEHTSANPTGPIHVGRARNPVIGDTLTRVLRKYGYKVETQYWVNDLGKQVASLVWGRDQIKAPESKPKKPDHELVYFYQKACEELKSKPELELQVEKILQAYERDEPKIKKKVRSACEKVLAGNIATLEKINVKLDKYVWESQSLASASEVVSKLKSSKLCREEEGAFYLDLKPGKFFFMRRDGTTLYATRDVAYHLDKFKNCDLAINILGEDHKLETEQLSSALEILGIDKKPENVFYSFVSLPEGRMSTRAGRVVWLDDLIEEAVERAWLEVKKRREEFARHEFRKLSDQELKKIAEIIGIGAIRYNIIKVQNEKPIIFKWQEALSFEGESAPFIQYAHARACSILRKSTGYKKPDFSVLKEPQELELIKVLAKFPEVVEDSARSRKPYKLASYAYEAAIQFNQFYRDLPVLKAEPKIRNARLALVDAFRIVLKNALELLGIQAPVEM